LDPGVIDGLLGAVRCLVVELRDRAQHVPTDKQFAPFPLVVRLIAATRLDAHQLQQTLGVT